MTPTSFGGFRDLYEAITDYPGDRLFVDVLWPALRELAALLEPLRKYRCHDSGEAVAEELWELFALSVVNDLLLEPMKISRGEYIDFFTALGFEPFRQQSFQPHLNEIVRVHNGAPLEEGIAICGSFWPGLMFGELVFSREGIAVSAHRSLGLIEGIADRSTLYFANRRLARRAADQSHGWGSNSRWRTIHHRNYETADAVIFNAGGEFDLADPVTAGPKTELSLALRRELVMHRCLVSQPDEGLDLYPYDDTLEVRRAPSLWPLDEALVRPAIRRKS